MGMYAQNPPEGWYLVHVGEHYVDNPKDWVFLKGFESVITAMKENVPKAEQSSVWIKRAFSPNWIGYTCRNCNHTYDAASNYCPNCGAKMNAKECVTDGTEFKIGDKVLFINAEMHATEPRHYPAHGTAGEVVGFGETSLLVQWPAGNTSDDDVWYCDKEDVRKAEE